MLALKLGLTPLLILAASLAGRRWGNAVGGWIVGLPLSSGPVSLFLTLEQGPAFAQQAAMGTLAGVVSQVCFGVTYFWVAGWAPWPVAIAAAAAGFIGCAALVQAADPPLAALFAVALAALAAGFAATPRRDAVRAAAVPPAWDIPARMAVAAALVLAITEGAASLGPRMSGIIASFPVFASVLMVFAHHVQGAPGARHVIRGLMMGLYGFVFCFATLGALLTRMPVAATYAAACLIGVLVQGVSFTVLRRYRRRGPE